ncbi:hypothetical protein H6503_02790 [Candidatus Woesearchaeota archaeon]|nr:hypothetical protein [Candidatus Woesearchaeota archaeon]
MRVNLLGVSHIWATIEEVHETLNSLQLEESNSVFLEPKRSIIQGEEICTEQSIQDFFDHIIDFCNKKRSSIIPLNPDTMLSHSSMYLYQKYALQLAEEEYMSDIIASSAKEGDCIIIGDIHAERLSRLLRNKNIEVNYIRIAPETPDDMLAKSWRDAIENSQDEVISIDWLQSINEKITEKMLLPKDILTQKACWHDKEMFRRYLALANRLTKEHKPIFQRLGPEILTNAEKITNEGRFFLKRSFKLEDHPKIFV